MLRVVVAGNSVALQVAPGREDRGSGTYSDLLRRRLEPLGGIVVNVAHRADQVDQDDLEFMANCQRNDPDAVILQYGIHEITPRILPRVLWNPLEEPGAAGDERSFLRRAGAFLEPTLVRWTRAGGWIGPKRFEQLYRYKIRIVHKESAAVPLVLNLGPPTPDLERRVPGITAAVDRTNGILERICREESAVPVDVHGLVRDRGAMLQPDGIHLAAEGHRAVFELLWDRLRERFPDLPEASGAATTGRGRD